MSNLSCPPERESHTTWQNVAKLGKGAPAASPASMVPICQAFVHFTGMYRSSTMTRRGPPAHCGPCSRGDRTRQSPHTAQHGRLHPAGESGKDGNGRGPHRSLNCCSACVCWSTGESPLGFDCRKRKILLPVCCGSGVKFIYYTFFIRVTQDSWNFEY